MKNGITSLAIAVLLTACTGSKDAPTAGRAAGATNLSTPSAAPAATASSISAGESVYKQSCSACHALGIAGAPKIGDPEAWAGRIAQGMNLLYEHSLKGYNGTKGVVPAKGGNPSLSDEKVRAAVDYMAGHSR